MARTIDVFPTVGLPAYNYVKPSQYSQVMMDFDEKGKHILVEGPSGVGKTCIIYKIIDEKKLKKNIDYTYISCRDSEHEEMLSMCLEMASTNSKRQHYYIIDDFHLLSVEKRDDLGSRLKRISDQAFSEEFVDKFILIGIPAAGEYLLATAKDLGPRIGMHKLNSVEKGKIEELIEEGEKILNIEFDDKNKIAIESNGNCYIAQYFCRSLCAQNGILETRENKEKVRIDIKKTRSRLIDELYTKYKGTLITLAKGKKWRPSGNKPYLDVIIALKASKRLVQTFDEVKSNLEKKKHPGLNSIRPRVSEVIFNPLKSIDLRKQIYFDGNNQFSIEDPLFYYMLIHFKVEDLFKDLGISENETEYEFEFAFSFAGETRVIVEYINKKLVDEEILTFYDFDHQAFLLGKDLAKYLGDVYSNGSKFYLIFIERNYAEKVWPTFERDIMMSSGRKECFIPVILEESIFSIIPGLSKSLGHINLSDQYSSSLAGNDEYKGYIDEKIIPLLIEKSNS